MKYHYQAFGLSIASEIELPELPTFETADPDLTIAFGEAPDRLTNPIAENVLVQSAPNEFLLTYDGVANYYATNGNKITIQADKEADHEKIKLFLMGTVLTALLHQRQLWPIHASGIEVEGKCIAFSGISGAGKSTTASQFAKRGYKVLADDVCAVTIDEHGVPVVQSGYPQLRLWKDSLNMLEVDHNDLTPVRNELMKFGYPIDDNFKPEPIPLKRIYMLQRHNKEGVEITDLKGAQKFQRMIRSTHKADLTKGQGNQKLQFQVCGDAAKHIDIRVVKHSYNQKDVDDFIDQLEQDFSK